MLIALILLAYLTVGMIVGRRDYARRVALEDRAETYQRLAALRKAQEALSHERSCWRGPVYQSKDRSCDCGNAGKWRSLDRAIAAMEAETEGYVSGPYKMMVLYPMIGFHRFMTSGTYKAAQFNAEQLAAAIERQEKELGIAS